MKGMFNFIIDSSQELIKRINYNPIDSFTYVKADDDSSSSNNNKYINESEFEIIRRSELINQQPPISSKELIKEEP